VSQLGRETVHGASALAENCRSSRFVVSLSSASAAQRVTNLPSLSQLLSEDLSTTIVGIDYRCEAEKSPTLFFATNGTEVDWNHLRAVPGLEISDWGNRYTRLTFTVTESLLERVA